MTDLDRLPKYKFYMLVFLGILVTPIYGIYFFLRFLFKKIKKHKYIFIPKYKKIEKIKKYLHCAWYHLYFSNDYSGYIHKSGSVLELLTEEPVDIFLNRLHDKEIELLYTIAVKNSNLFIPIRND